MKKHLLLFTVLAFSFNLSAQRGATIAVPDSIFDKYIYDKHWDADDVADDGLVGTKYLTGVKSINIERKNISDLTGIEGFIALESLFAGFNQLDTVDLSNNTNLKTILLNSNQLTSLNLGDNNVLEHLNLLHNQFDSLDLNNNNISSLKYLQLGSNNLTTWNESAFPALVDIEIQYNQLTSFSLTNCPYLEDIFIDGNQLTNFDVSNNNSLERLRCEDNQLTSLDGSSFSSVFDIRCGGNPQLASIDLSANSNLDQFFCSKTALASIDLSANSKIDGLECDSIPQLTSLNIKNGNNISWVEASGNTNLFCIEVDSVEHAQESLNDQWWTVDSWTNFSKKCAADFTITIPNDTIPDNTSYTTGATPARTGDDPVGYLTYTLAGIDKDLFTINNSTGIVDMVARNFDAPADNGKDNVYQAGIIATDVNSNADTVYWSVTIAALTYMPDNGFEQALFDLGLDNVLDDYVLTLNIDTLTSLSLFGYNVIDATGIEDFIALTNLNVNGNQLTSLDVSNNIALMDLNCENNQLANLDLSKNTALKTLDCSDNKLANLNIKNGNNSGITSLDARSNPLLICVQVDDAQANHSGWDIGTGANYSDDCLYIDFTIDAITNDTIAENIAYTGPIPNISGDTPVGDTIYSLAGSDALQFSIDTITGVINMVAQSFESPLDNDSNNIYEIGIIVTDAMGNSDEEFWTVTITDVHESANFQIDPNTGIPNPDEVDENTLYVSNPVTTKGGVPIGSLTWAISGGTDSKFMSIDSVTGVVTMVAQDFESPLDHGKDNVYGIVNYKATDEDGNYAAGSFTIEVLDVTEFADFILDAIDATNINENDATYQSALPGITGDDPIGKLKYTLTGPDAGEFEIDPSAGIVSMEHKNHESPTDEDEDNVYEAWIIATDQDLNADTISWTITIDNVDETFMIDPVANDTITIIENNSYTSDIPNFTGTPGILTWTLTGADANQFGIDPATGTVDMAAMDFELPTDANGDRIYEIGVAAINEDGDTDTISWSIAIADIDDTAPVITLNGSATVSIDIEFGESYIELGATTDEKNLTDSILIVSNVVATIVGDYQVTYNVKDSVGNQAVQIIRHVTVIDNTPIHFTIDEIVDITIDENTVYTGPYPALSGDDPIGNVTYILAGKDARQFTINNSTGVIGMVAQDFENPADNDSNNVYEVGIIASDQDENVAPPEFWTVTVDNVNEAAPIVINPLTDTLIALIDEALIIELDELFYDEDGSRLIITVTLEDGSTLPAWGSYTNETLTIAPLFEDRGFYNLKITATDPGGLSVSDTFKINIDTKTGFEDIENSPIDVKMYPNPANDLVKLEIKGNSNENIEIVVIDITGKEILRKISSTDLIEFNMDGHVSGMYFVKIYIDDNELIKKLILK